MNPDRLAGVLTPVLAQFDLDLDAVEIIPAGKRRLLRVVVDGDGPTGRGPLLDDIARASKACSIALDDSDVTGAAAYTLELSSRGVSRPLELPRHWRRNVGRLVAVTTGTGDRITGRILEASENGVRLEIEGAAQDLALTDIRTALVQVELNRKPTAVDTVAVDEEEEDQWTSTSPC